MPSLEHEFLLDIFKARPELAPELLSDSLGVVVPPFDEVQVASGEFTRLAPTKYWADAVLTLVRAGKPVLGVILEVQLHRVRRKRASWVAYLGNLHAQLGCPVILLVVCPNRKLAAWAARPYSLGHPGLLLTPVVLGPDRVPVVTTVRAARHNPELAVLSALTHGGQEQHARVLTAVWAGLGRLDKIDEARARLYADVVFAALPDAARKRLEELMGVKTYKYYTDFARRLVAEGEAMGEARAVLAVLHARGIVVPDEVRERITGCADVDTLEQWTRRAATATSLDDVFA